MTLQVVRTGWMTFGPLSKHVLAEIRGETASRRFAAVFD